MGRARAASSTRLLAATFLTVALFTGCGSGEEAGTDSTSPTATPPATNQQPATTNPTGESDPQTPSSDQETKQPQPPPDLPPPTPGSKAAAPGVPTSKHGDNSIQTWGLEAADGEREEATATVQRYLDARAAGNWSTVCQLLAAKPRREQEQFGGGASCAQKPKSKSSASGSATSTPS
jgi:hypothetical protein